MKKPIKTILMARLLAAFMAVFLLPAAAGAESNVGMGSDAQVSLDFQINIPTILFLRIGSAGTGSIDAVRFDVGNIPQEALTVPATTPAVTVQVGAIIGSSATINLEADSSTALNDGGSNDISFKTISWTGTGSFDSGTFGGTSADFIASFTGPGLREGTFDFSYVNGYYPPGTYTGTVTYTLSSP